nr:MAG TPA_asm: hypothetical protein [Caudoviricetes sp.]
MLNVQKSFCKGSDMFLKHPNFVFQTLNSFFR